ncbi:MAG: DegQ family serine endoprotease [Candidatus Sulfobium sp.]
MKQKKMASLAAVVLFSLVTVFFALCQTGCERIETSYKTVGFPKSFAELAERVNPAVVNISTDTTVRVPGGPFSQFFGPFFGQMPDREMKQKSLGSGFIIDSDGFILTNNHVVAGAQEIKVKLADGREYKAKVVGRDPKTDLALIKISSMFKNLPTLPLGNSDKMKVGDWVLAIGNPFGLGHTVTQGIISATGRVIGSGPYDNFLQTDAPINPGNSGGPLVNLEGQVIGINSAIIASGQGIGFAIPSNMAKQIVSQLKTKGKVVRGWIGVSIQTVTPAIAQAFGLKNDKGALVAEAVPNGPAQAAGIKQGDVIVSFNGKTINRMSDLPFIVAETPVGKTVPVTVVRNGKELTLNIKIAEMPQGQAAGGTPAPAERLGLTISNITPQIRNEFGLTDTSGVLVVNVSQGSLAADAGIQPGDIIKEVNRMPVKDVSDYESAIRKWEKNKPLLLLIKRKGQTFFVSIKAS